MAIRNDPDRIKQVNSPDRKVLSAKQVAEMLGIDPRTVRKYADRCQTASKSDPQTAPNNDPLTAVVECPVSVMTS